MSQKMLNELLQQGESEVLEFKTSFGREVMVTLMAFANAKGGRLLLGVNNKHEVVGVSVSQESPQQWINQIKQPQLLLLYRKLKF
jgi:ATP-dependent DNA helicase RecG